MKKTILFMAALAALAVVTSCSSDEELVQEPVMDPVQITDSGIPLTVNASTGDDATRAVELTNTNFDSFQLWAFEGDNQWVGNPIPEDQDETQTGTAISKTSTSPWTSPSANWPSTTGTSKFYAISAASTTTNELTPNITATSQSFTYTVAADAADQEDLLVGSATATAKGVDGKLGTTDDGKVNIDFRHILSKVNFTFKLDPLVLKDGGLDVTSNMGFNVLINKVTLGRIKNTGVFTFATNYDQNGEVSNASIGSWNSDASEADQIVVIPFDSPLLVAAGFTATGQGTYDPDTEEYESYLIENDDFGVQNESADEYISNPGMVLPQVVEDVWTGTVDSWDGAYVAIDAKIFWYYTDEMVTYLTGKGYTLSGDYYVDGSNNRIARKGGVILDYTKIGDDYSGDIQITTSDEDQAVGGGEPGSNNPNKYGYGTIYKKLGTGTLAFIQGKPFRLKINLTNCYNQNSVNAWGDLGTVSASRALNDDIVCE